LFDLLGDRLSLLSFRRMLFLRHISPPREQAHGLLDIANGGYMFLSRRDDVASQASGIADVYVRIFLNLDL